jgi:hypothetical protein
LPPPPDYDNADTINTDRDQKLADLATIAVNILLDMEDVKRVVFVYLNHGAADALGGGNELFTVLSFVICARAAVKAQKPLLFVVGSCDSTSFAAAVWRNLVPQVANAEQFIGFLTSGDGDCFTSAMLLSRDASLVDVFDPQPDEPQVRDELVPGYLITNSMFARQLLSLWVYRARELEGKTLGDLADLMNDPEVPWHFGFQAAFRRGGTTFAHYQVDSFFPLQPITSETAIRGQPGKTFGAAIPAKRMGEQFDDIGRFWTEATQDRGYAYKYVKIERQDDGTIKEVGTGDLEGATDPIELQIYDHVKMKRGSGPPTGAGDEVEVPYVPIDSVFRVFCRIATEQGLQWTRGGLTLDAYLVMKQFLKKEFGPIPHYMWNYVSRLGEASCDVGDPAKFWEVVQIACDEVKGTLAVPHPPPEGESSSNLILTR